MYDSQRVITEVLSLFILFLRGMPLNSTLLCVPCFTSTPSTLRDIHWNRCTRTKSSVNAKPALQHSFNPSGTSTSPAHEMTHATSRNCAAGRASHFKSNWLRPVGGRQLMDESDAGREWQCSLLRIQISVGAERHNWASLKELPWFPFPPWPRWSPSRQSFCARHRLRQPGFYQLT